MMPKSKLEAPRILRLAGQMPSRSQRNLKRSPPRPTTNQLPRHNRQLNSRRQFPPMSLTATPLTDRPYLHLRLGPPFHLTRNMMSICSPPMTRRHPLKMELPSVSLLYPETPDHRTATTTCRGRIPEPPYEIPQGWVRNESLPYPTSSIYPGWETRMCLGAANAAASPREYGIDDCTNLIFL